MTLLFPCRYYFRCNLIFLSILTALIVCIVPQAPGQAPPLPGTALIPAEPDPNLVIPHFDVISVKPGKDNFTMMQFTPDGIRAKSVTVQFLLYEGYGGISHEQVIGEPSWSRKEGFDIEAKVAAADVPTLGRMTMEQRRTMFLSILAERFQLVAHHETRELPVYILSIAKGGPKLKPGPPNYPTGMSISNGKVTGKNAKLAMLVTVLSRTLGRVIVDNTGLAGAYDYTLEFAPEEGAPQPPADGASADPKPSIFTALKEELGLKLESAKRPVDVVVIDHIEKPAEN